MDKSYRIFVEGTRVMLTSRLAYENTPSLRRSIDKRLENSADRMDLVTRDLKTVGTRTVYARPNTASVGRPMWSERNIYMHV